MSRIFQFELDSPPKRPEPVLEKLKFWVFFMMSFACVGCCNKHYIAGLARQNSQDKILYLPNCLHAHDHMRASGRSLPVYVLPPLLLCLLLLVKWSKHIRRLLRCIHRHRYATLCRQDRRQWRVAWLLLALCWLRSCVSPQYLNIFRSRSLARSWFLLLQVSKCLVSSIVFGVNSDPLRSLSLV